MGSREYCEKCGYFFIIGQESEECPHDLIENVKEPEQKEKREETKLNEKEYNEFKAEEIKNLEEMTKLKTIEDIEKEILDIDEIPDFLINAIRQEAIKHYKHYSRRNYINVALWIKMFFNLTEEDLKNG